MVYDFGVPGETLLVQFGFCPRETSNPPEPPESTQCLPRQTIRLPEEENPSGGINADLVIVGKLASY